MKKKLILLLAFFINISYFCYSQPHHGEGMKKAQMVLEDYLTKELNLSAEESQKLKPVYKSYFSEVREAKRENNSDPIATEEKVLNIRKKYRDDFKKILGSDERVNKLLLAEKNFRDILRKELMQRRLNREGPKPPNVQ
jgi:hypothetical protein